MTGRPGDGAARAWAWRWSAVALWGSLALVLADMVAHQAPGPYQLPHEIGLAFAGYGAVGIGFAIRVAIRRPRLDRRSRRAWSLVAASFTLLMLQGFLQAAFPASVFPSPSSFARMAFVPVMLAGLLTLPMRLQSAQQSRKVWLDAGVVLLASGMVMWYLDIGPGIAQFSQLTGSVLLGAVCYPALDLLLVFGATILLLRGSTQETRRPAALLVMAMLVIIVGDTGFGYQEVRPGATNHPDLWEFVAWICGHFLLALAAFTQCRRSGNATKERGTPAAQPSVTLPYVPYMAIGIGYSLLVLAMIGQPIRIYGLVVGAVGLTAIVVVRQIVALRENHDLAITDALTGLVNRRRLHEILGLALSRSSGNGQTVAAMLIDLNGFKQVNDTLGHETGDQLLVVVADILRRNVLGLDVVARLGGDEFAIVLHNIGTPDNAVAVAQRVISATQQPVTLNGATVTPQLSIGIAVASHGELTGDELLHHADLAMYQAKRHKHTIGSAYEIYEPGLQSAGEDGGDRGQGALSRIPKPSDGRAAQQHVPAGTGQHVAERRPEDRP